MITHNKAWSLGLIPNKSLERSARSCGETQKFEPPIPTHLPSGQKPGRLTASTRTLRCVHRPPKRNIHLDKPRRQSTEHPNFGGRRNPSDHSGSYSPQPEKHNQSTNKHNQFNSELNA